MCIEKGSWEAQLKFVRLLRRRAFDGVIDLTDGDGSAAMSLATSAVRVGFNAEHRWRGLLYSAVAIPSSTDQHRVEYDLCALRHLGLHPKPGTPVVYVSPAEEQAVEAWLQEAGLRSSRDSPLLLLLQPGARYSLKVWPHERFVELADRLANRFSCRILLGGDQREQAIAEEIARKTRCAPMVVAGEFSLLQFASLAKRCALFVGNDGGAMHIASAMGTPVVALFGPTYPRHGDHAADRPRSSIRVSIVVPLPSHLLARRRQLHAANYRGRSV